MVHKRQLCAVLFARAGSKSCRFKSEWFLRQKVVFRLILGGRMLERDLSMVGSKSYCIPNNKLFLSLRLKKLQVMTCTMY